MRAEFASYQCTYAIEDSPGNFVSQILNREGVVIGRIIGLDQEMVEHVASRATTGVTVE